MDPQTIFATLRDTLATLYPETADARLIVNDAGLDASAIAFSERAQTNWHNILAAALNQKRLDALLQVVQRAYPTNPPFQAAYADYARFVAQGGHLVAPPPSVTASEAAPAIDTAGGTYIGGNVTADAGDLIARDQHIAGDKVSGDKFDGDRIDARQSQGYINRPSAPVIQHFGNTVNIGPLKIPKPVAAILFTSLIALLILVVIIAFSTRGTFQAITATPTLTPLPTATPLAFAPQSAGETLIVVATFHNTAATNTEPHIKIWRAIAAEIVNHNEQQVRIETEPTKLTADQRGEAEALGQRYNASMVIWGEDTGVEVRVNFLNLREPNVSAASTTITETERTQLANPSAYASFITKDLPRTMNFFVFFAIGQSYYLNSQYALATTRIETAIAKLPPEAKPQGLADAYFSLGWLYQVPTPNNLNQAIADYTKAIALDPDYAFAYHNRGIARYDQGKLDDAIADYSKAIALDPDYAVAYYNRGLARYAQGKLDDAIADYTKAIDINPDYANAYNNRGNALKAQGKLDDAIADYTKAIDINPDFEDAYNSLCWTYGLTQQPTLALPNCHRAIELDPSPFYYDSRGLAYALLQEFPAAIADFQTFVDFLESLDDPELAKYAEIRKTWIAELKAGTNPFTPAVLEALRHE